jgi:hypothetical protein
MQSGPWFALMSLRSFEFLAIAVLAVRFSTCLPSLGRWMLWLLAVELVLVVFEFVFAMPTRGCPRAYRASGTFVLPSTLGFVAVAIVAFVLVFVPRLKRRLAVAAAMAALLLVLASGSGTGLAMLAAIGGWLLFAHMPGRRVLVGAALAFATAALVWLLPVITQRADIYDSLFGHGGRWDKLEEVVSANDLRANLIGRGLGVGTNQAAGRAERGPAHVPDSIKAGQPFYADSTITWLVVQLGALGLLAFYLVLGWAFVVDVKARLFYFAIGVASLTISLPEAFPINFLLGLALAHSATQWRGRGRAGQGA